MRKTCSLFLLRIYIPSHGTLWILFLFFLLSLRLFLLLPDPFPALSAHGVSLLDHHSLHNSWRHKDDKQYCGDHQRNADPCSGNAEFISSQPFKKETSCAIGSQVSTWTVRPEISFFCAEPEVPEVSPDTTGFHKEIQAVPEYRIFRLLSGDYPSLSRKLPRNVLLKGEAVLPGSHWCILRKILC